MKNAQTMIVVKRSARRKNDGAHGGAWKVAFADFTMAMMALFMVLWITAQTTQEERAVVSQALRDYSMLDGSPNPFTLSGDSVLDVETYPSMVKGIAEDVLEGGAQQRDGEVNLDQSFTKESQKIFDAGFRDHSSMRVLEDVVNELSEQMGAVDNLSVEIVPQGLRIRLQDDEDRQMFQRGGTIMDGFFEDVLMNLSPLLARIDNGLVISGHTDSSPFPSLDYGNWELSGERASMARQVLAYGGMPETNLLQVNAMADKMLVDEENPLSSENRRIEILVLTEQAENELMGLFDDKTRNSQINQMRQDAQSNQPVTR